jgi:hypothetical protein
MDLRKDYDEMVMFESKSDESAGTLYRKGVVNQIWWKRDILGRVFKKNITETWRAFTEEDAKENFQDFIINFK